MTKFKTSDRNDQSVNLLDDTALDTVVGGIDDPNLRGSLSLEPAVAANPVGGTFKGVLAKPLGTSH
jgi:hypothetical protein